MLLTVSIIHDTIDTATAGADPLSSLVTQSQDITENSSTAESTTCRYGVSSWNANDTNFLQDLGIGWVLNFGGSFPNYLPDGVEFTPMVRFKPQLDGNGNRTGNYRVISQPFTDAPGGLGPVIAARPGTLWLIGNEVERTEYQDDLMPNEYAKAYHDAYHFIKERDPSAQIAISALVEVTPGRLQYLDLVWSSYLAQYGTTMPVDYWNMHIYVLPEINQNGVDSAAGLALGTDPAIAIFNSSGGPCSAANVYCWKDHDNMTLFKEQAVAMRQWMKNHGQQNKPLLLSEYSLLPYVDFQDENGEDFSEDRVQQFMKNTFEYIESTEAIDANLGYPKDNNRLIQQSLWFTVYSDDSFSSNLVEENYDLKLPGLEFRNKIDGQRPFSTNPVIDYASPATGKTTTPGGTASVTIGATLYNNGDTATTTGTTVNFYANAAKTDLIGTAIMPAGLPGCVRSTDQVSITWDNLEEGVHSYWAEVNGSNTVQGIVIINPEEVFLPAVSRP
ncbi:MAG: hypothetical protein DWQ04_21260 [Chloroflexi bacterium]|nr:MAG: hypothetical protein DWQ04_21260 [Chloroflexota bacterium]